MVLITSASRGLSLELAEAISGGVLPPRAAGIPRKIRRESIMKGTFDEALECLRGAGSEVAGGVAPNHGPMAAEALVALGRDVAYKMAILSSLATEIAEERPSHHMKD